MWQRVLFGRVSVLPKRKFSCYDPLQRRFSSLDLLKTSIQARATEDAIKDTRAYLDSFKDLFDYSTESSLSESQALQNLSYALISGPRELSEETFKRVFHLGPPPLLIPSLLQAYQNRRPDAAIPRDIAITALRRSLWDADIQTAVKVVDLTAASPQYLELMRSKRNNTIMKSFAALCCSIGGIDVALRMFDVSPQIGVYGMVITYLGNLAFFGFTAFGGKLTGEVSDIRWQSGVSSNHKILHADELLMLSKIAEADIQLSKNDGFTSDGFNEALEKRGMEPIHPESDLLLQEYWLSGGDNFEWVEPDQDPADIQWSKHVETKKPNLLKSDIKWTEKFIPASGSSPTSQSH